MSLKVSRCLLSFVLLLVLFAAQLPVNAQSVPCSAITRNPLVLEALLDSHSKDAEPDLEDDTINGVQLERLQFSPIVIQPGDALYVEYSGRASLLTPILPAGRELNSTLLRRGVMNSGARGFFRSICFVVL